MFLCVLFSFFALRGTCPLQVFNPHPKALMPFCSRFTFQFQHSLCSCNSLPCAQTRRAVSVQDACDAHGSVRETCVVSEGGERRCVKARLICLGLALIKVGPRESWEHTGIHSMRNNGVCYKSFLTCPSCFPQDIRWSADQLPVMFLWLVNSVLQILCQTSWACTQYWKSFCRILSNVYFWRVLKERMMGRG